MNTITQEAYHRQRMIKFFKNNGAMETAFRYKVSRKTVYKWVNRYDGTLESLKDKSRKPHNSPKKHSEVELKLIKRCAKKYSWIDLILAFQLACSKGYTRTYGSFKRIVSKIKKQKPVKKRLKKKLQLYKRAEYPGQKLQLDVKFVPSYCIVNGKKYYQYTAKDECSRWTYREIYEEHSTYSSYDFLQKLIKKAPFPIREIQTDNGTEFTNTLLLVKAKHKSMFEEALEKLDIIYHRIRIATPRHNGKVERQHRTDEMRFYKNMKMYNLDDGRRQLSVYQANSNNYIMTCLNMRSPNQILANYLHIM